MKVTDSRSGRGFVLKTVELDDEEMSLPDDVLVSMADGRSKKEALDIHIAGLHPGHFGGTVQRTTTGATIKIYTD